MEKNKKIEIIILITLFLAIFTFGFSFFHYKIEKPNTYNIIFKDIDSIVKGSPVRFMGINIGYVLKLKRKDDHIVCKIRVTKKHVKLPNGTRAKVAFNGLGGSKSIELFPPETNEGNPTGIITEEFLRINDFVSVIKDLREVFHMINNMVQKMNTDTMSDTMKEITNPEGITKINDIMDKTVDRVIEKEQKINKGLNKINEAINIKMEDK